MRGIYAEVVEQGHIDRNPFGAVSGLRKDEDLGRREPFTGAEVSALIIEAKGDWQGLIILAASTGLRLMDAARLKWRDLDFDSALIRTKTSKTALC